MARLMTSGMVKTSEIGQSAAKSYRLLFQKEIPMDAVQRLNGGGQRGIQLAA